MTGEPSFCHRCEVAFGDTDASGRVHFPNVFRYFEQAEHAFLRSRGVPVFGPGGAGWPRVSARCEYRLPLGAGDRIEVRIRLAGVGRSSLSWEFEVLDAGRQLAAEGAVTVVKVDAEGRPVAVSAVEREALGAAGS
jgi:acyl-CoA thioester hydrolase